MKQILFLFALLFQISLFAQENPLEKFEGLIGKWEGTGAGFGNSKSVIHSEFNWVLNQQFIEVKNHSEFPGSTENPAGETHDDWGMISFDQARKVVVFRQFHNEGFVNQYILNNDLSNENKLVFESESIENFVPGGTAKFTILIKSETEIETIFDVGFPGKEMACFGQNKLIKQ